MFRLAAGTVVPTGLRPPYPQVGPWSQPVLITHKKEHILSATSKINTQPLEHQ